MTREQLRALALRPPVRRARQMPPVRGRGAAPLRRILPPEEDMFPMQHPGRPEAQSPVNLEMLLAKLQQRATTAGLPFDLGRMAFPAQEKPGLEPPMRTAFPQDEGMTAFPQQGPERPGMPERSAFPLTRESLGEGPLRTAIPKRNQDLIRAIARGRAVAQAMRHLKKLQPGQRSAFPRGLSGSRNPIQHLQDGRTIW